MIALRAWLVMLALGMLHAGHSAIPALGYWHVVLLVVIADLVMWKPYRATPKVGE